MKSRHKNLQIHDNVCLAVLFCVCVCLWIFESTLWSLFLVIVIGGIHTFRMRLFFYLDLQMFEIVPYLRCYI